MSSVTLTLLINVMVRTGWTRLCCFYALKYTIGQKSALSLFAPTAYSKLHDETKIYAGYFRFPPILALIIARALVYQDLTFSQHLSASYNDSALLAVLCMMVTEFLSFACWMFFFLFFWLLFFLLQKTKRLLRGFLGIVSVSSLFWPQGFSKTA